MLFKVHYYTSSLKIKTGIGEKGQVISNMLMRTALIVVFKIYTSGIKKSQGETCKIEVVKEM